jgi:hypothetical protein
MRVAPERRVPPARWLGRGTTIAALSLAGAGCALTGPAPGGALREGTFTQAQPTWAISYAPAKATVHAATAGVRGNGGALSGNAQSLGGDQALAAFGALLPIDVALRQSIGRSVELAADGGWLDSGFELRAGVPDAEAQWPVVVSAGGRLGRLGLLGLQPDGYQARLRLEAYPRIRQHTTASVRGVLALGGAFGSFLHDMAIPAEPDPNPPEIGGGPPHVLLLRPELRVEGIMGIQRRARHVSVMFAVAPWVVAANGTAKSASSDWIVDAFSQDMGVTFLISVAIGSDHSAPPLLSR